MAFRLSSRFLIIFLFKSIQYLNSIWLQLVKAGPKNKTSSKILTFAGQSTLHVCACVHNKKRWSTLDRSMVSISLIFSDYLKRRQIWTSWEKHRRGHLIVPFCLSVPLFYCQVMMEPGKKIQSDLERKTRIKRNTNPLSNLWHRAPRKGSIIRSSMEVCGSKVEASPVCSEMFYYKRR